MTIIKEDYGSQSGDGGIWVYKDKKLCFGKSMFQDMTLDDVKHSMSFNKGRDKDYYCLFSELTKKDIIEIKKLIDKY